MKIRFLLVAIILFCSHLPATAEGSDNLKVYPEKEKMEICAGASGIITIKIEIPGNLYIYGNPKGPGVGRPTTVDITHPHNFIFDYPRFAKPEKYTAKGDPNFVWIYRNETRIDLPLKVKKDSITGEYRISILIKTLVCSDRACTPHDFTIDYPVKVSPDASHAAENKNDSKSNSLQSWAFSSPGKDNSNLSANENNSFSDKISLFKPRFFSSVNISNILQAIFYGLLAGFILNFMPCVLPVISLKIMDIIKYSGGDRKEIMKIGLVFTMGILTTFAVLASLAAFLEYSWGGLFQNSLFLIIMIGVVFVFSLSMFEIFTINVPAFAGRASQGISNKYTQAYAKGLLATLLATPCSGPFLGGTIAWASTQPHIVIFIIFMSIGLGMSAPYIILTANPRLMRFIPEPGAWMVTFESIMAFFLLGTCVYLIGILKQSLIMPTLWFLLFITIAFWQYGKYGSIIKHRKNRIISRIAAILIIASGYFLSYNFFYDLEENPDSIGSRKKSFSLSLLFENRDKGKISIVDFTADWCPNCKLVEKTSLYTAKVAKAITKNNIELLVADLTRENPQAKALLNRLGSRSIPFLAIFPAGEDFFQPICLRDIYSADDVLNAIEMAE